MDAWRARREQLVSLYRKKESRAMRVRSVLMRAQKRKALRGKFISNDEKTTRPLKRLQKNKEGENTKFSHPKLTSLFSSFLSFFLSFFDETPNFHLAFAKQTRRRTFLYKEEEEEEEEEKNVHETKNVREKIQRTMRLCSHDDDDDEYDEREGILIGAFFFALQK